ncbi:MAG: fructose-6-phosphate aldolase [Phycisphaerae bacterium]|nr:fructose-6-phosphate aldolase [Phycisphaerae bacterium]|tara:strand:- start:2834 stop:3490 length:657 start_codon:yes stop_codon:yes gene_type:complete
MQIYIDTASIEDIRAASDMGVLDGVTTNPSLVAKEGVDFHDRLKEICDVVPGPVSAEVVSTESDGMLEEAKPLLEIADNIVIKLPCTVDGLRACKHLSSNGVRVNMTLCFQPLQAMLAAKAGAFLISPFLGRLDDLGQDSMDLIQQIRTIYDNYGYETKVLAASVRHPMHLVECALVGADVATVPFKVIQQMMNHPLTDSGLKKFLDDWAAMNTPSSG